MSAIYLLLLLASCTDGSNPIDTDTNPGGDADTDTDADSDSDADADFETVEFTLQIPTDDWIDATATTVLVTLGSDDPVEMNICDGSTCVYALETRDDVGFALKLNGGNGGSTTIPFAADDIASGTPASVAWPSTCGCTDTAWDPLSGTRCVNPDSGDIGWVQGQYGLAMQGEYYDQDEHDETCVADTHEKDSNGDGLMDWFTEGCGGQEALWVCGETIYFDTSSASTAYSGKVQENLESVELVQLGVSGAAAYITLLRK